jgi:hypothetical protein
MRSNLLDFYCWENQKQLAASTDLFEQLNKQYKVYIKRQVNVPVKFDFMMNHYPPAASEDDARQQRFILLQKNLILKKKQINYYSADTCPQAYLSIKIWKYFVSGFYLPLS